MFYNKKNGFSLIEVLIVIAIISILAAVIIPNIQKFYKIYKYQEYAYSLESAVKWAKLTAMQRSINVGVCKESATNIKIVNMGSQRTNICSGSDLKVLTIKNSDNFVTFAGTGSAFDPKGFSITTGNVCITDGTKNLNITISKFGVIDAKKNIGVCS
ncbi:MAG: prepilin-type N-terminal cleavage/methylation domain-containing protein [Thermodesulfovibrionales bacterium]|nr:prepilin-type N-terminal cleavage/methylation domain-containing protein [Thermodesulfovibrionales bacterium]